ncbi:hypothetical protein [Nocardioides coralli]|uniref:hypothetical protein n=1 Tax=Nocardioides coralli TaxID=2872154 RepID=UPI001CA39EC2|nr:hypothetical protein [Nocardioides coralli]QZY28828.1 hypothetical protein K6T13_15460 [Nocardioides coralli]
MYNMILEAAAKQMEESGEASADEVTVDLKARLRPKELPEGETHPLGGCVEVCVGVIVQVCYHRNFKGSRPGKG